MQRRESRRQEMLCLRRERDYATNHIPTYNHNYNLYIRSSRRQEIKL